MATPRSPSVTGMRYLVSRRDTLGPVWSAVPAPTFTQGVAASYSLSAISSDPTSAPITYTSVGAALPSGITINNTTKALDYSGGGSAATTTGVILRATSSGGYSDSVTFSLPILPVSGDVVTTWAALNLQTNPISRLTMDAATPNWGPNQGVTFTYEAGGAWDGSNSWKITPPTTGDGGYAALGGFGNLNRGGALAIRQFNLRFEILFGPTFGAGQQNQNDNKFIIIHAGNTNTATSQHRPMVNLWKEGGTLFSVAVGAGTVKQFDPTGATNEYFPGSGKSSFYFGDSGTTGGPGSKPIVTPLQWHTFEVFGSAVPISGFPNGCHRIRITNRAGVVLTTVTIPWNYDSWSAVDYFNEVQVLGGYYNNNAGAANAGNYQRIAGVTFAANQTGFLGPRAGFVL